MITKTKYNMKILRIISVATQNGPSHKDSRQTCYGNGFKQNSIKQIFMSTFLMGCMTSYQKLIFLLHWIALQK